MRIIKKLLSAGISFALLLSTMSVMVFADDLPTYSGGDGTENNPYLISSVEDLLKLATTVNSGAAQNIEADDAGIGNYYGYYFKQTKDIDLNGVDWEPIGYTSDGLYFSGNYDGGNHKILNMKTDGKMRESNDSDINGQTSAGFFGWVILGSVSNLHIVDAQSVASTVESGKGQPYAGGLAAVIHGSSVYNCSVTGSKIWGERGKNLAWAGGLAGWSYSNSSFENCFCDNNTVVGDCYTGGLIGEIAEYDTASTKNLKNCYVANSKVNTTGNAQLARMGGLYADVDFDGVAPSVVLTNCYIYNVTFGSETGEMPTNSVLGVFSSNISHNIIITNSYYYTTETDANKIGYVTGATAKTVDDFRNGTVTGLLGSAYVQGTNYPVLKSGSADYTAVEVAIELANTYTPADYTNFSAVTDAINAVVYGKNASEQSVVDGYADAINSALSALERVTAGDDGGNEGGGTGETPNPSDTNNGGYHYIDDVTSADYSAVEKAIADAKTYNANDYKNFSSVTDAINAVVYGKTASEQSVVDGYAKAINDAISALEYKPADYTRVNEAIDKFNELDKNEYEDVAEVEQAIESVVYDKTIDEQSVVDGYADAIEKALSKLLGDTLIPDPDANPATSDSANTMLWLVVVLTGGVVVSASLTRKKRSF